MTENKRFIIDKYYHWVDTVTGKWITEEYAFDLINKLAYENEQFHNIARDYNIPFEKLCSTFEDVLDENEQLKQQLGDRIRYTHLLETELKKRW